MAPQKSVPQESGKQRAARIPLDYYKRGDNLERWKLRLAGVALLATLGWLGASWALSGQDDFQSSRGPLASVHQNWDTQCQACHEPFTSISSHSWNTPLLGDATESSQKCQACHSGAVHHMGQSPELSCASCHRDHRGREASLVKLPDSDCTQCHNNLSQHFGHRPQSDVPNVVEKFAKGTHPRFRSLAADPGKLNFDHRLHLSAGLALKEGTQVGGTLRSLAQIPAPFRERYRRQQQDKTETAPVQLQCASCHQLDAGDQAGFAPAAQKSAGLRGSGAYMLPITYDNHCQACHPLTADHKPADAKLTQIAVPHGWQPQEIRPFLDNQFTAKFARSFWEDDAKIPKKDRPLPGHNLADGPRTAVPGVELKKAEEATRFAEKYLYLPGKSGCALCHEIKKPAGEYQVTATNVPKIWLKHARFNHTAHRAVTCQECHAGAAESRKSEDVLIPDQDNCVKCHVPVTSAKTPGVRYSCTTCHLYHNGDHSLQGIGAARRQPRQPRTISDFLLGVSE